MRSQEELAELDDPAEDDGAYVREVHEAAERQLGDDGTEADWDELSERERRAKMDGRPLPDEGSPVSDSPAGASNIEDVDWQAFAREFNFHLGGQGAQDEWAADHVVELAVGVSDHIDTASPGSFLQTALDDDSVPLCRHAKGIIFREEVLAR